MNKLINLFKNISQRISNLKESLNTLILFSTPYNKIAEQKISAFTKRRLFFTLSLIITFLVIYGMLFYTFTPDVIFKNTTTISSWDTTAHNYIAKFFIDELFPNFRMTGWDMGWFAGMPMLTFYFPFPYFLIALLSKIFVFNISFKLVTILGCLILPAAIYYFGKSFKFKYPYPELAAIGAIAFLYMGSFVFDGGNLLGILVGQFSYSISFGLMFIFLGLLYRGVEEGRFGWLFALNCVVLTSIVLTHLVILTATIIIVPSIFLLKRSWKSAGYIIAVFAVGFFLSAFWSLPFVLQIEWTSPMLWRSSHDLDELFPHELIPAMFFSLVGLSFTALKKDKRMFPIIWTIAIFLPLIFSWDVGRIYNIRFRPFIFIFIYLLAAYGLKNLYWILVTAISSLRFTSIKEKFFKFVVIALVPIVAIMTSGAIIAGNPRAPSLARSFYSGLESRAEWKLYNNIMEYLDSLPYGRVMHDYNRDMLPKFGGTRVFELIPYWTKQPTMDGLLTESAFSSHFHLINEDQFKLQDDPSLRDYEASMKYLIYFNTSYIIASTPEVIEDLNNDSRVELINKIEPYYFYEVIGLHNYVEIVKNMPYRYKTEEWLSEIKYWYWYEDNIDNPIVYDDGSKELKQFEEITQVTDVPDNPVNVKGEVISETLEREKIEFTTTAIGVPHLIKVSYFPNWKAIGAEGPYLVSPSLMMVIPTQSHVTVYYGMTYANIIGVTLSIAGWVIIGFILLLNLLFYLKSKVNFKKLIRRNSKP